jgi:8-oxo-dGTP pyrophosphatase MutT (NUDIX family)
MDFDDLVPRLPAALRAPLPGATGQLRMSPRPRVGWRPGHVPDDCRHGGALLLVYPRDGNAHLLLTVRSASLPQHGGQVSLPGGAVEPGESFDRAALREAHEEVGIEPDHVRLVGSLSSIHVPVSRFVLHPWVGVAKTTPGFRADPAEVARILEVPFAHLVDPARIATETRDASGRTFEVPFFEVDGEKVWGATAMVLAEFLCALGRFPDQTPKD